MGASCEPNADRRLQLVSSTEAILTVTSIQAECVSPIPSHITDLAHFRFRWFGLILLPFVSFSADGVNVILETSVAVVKYWCEPKESKSTTNASGAIGNASVKPNRRFAMWNNPLLTSEFAHGRPIDMSIQFTLCWTPLLVLFGWWFEKPMHLLFGE